MVVRGIVKEVKSQDREADGQRAEKGKGVLTREIRRRMNDREREKKGGRNEDESREMREKKERTKGR